MRLGGRNCPWPENTVTNQAVIAPLEGIKLGYYRRAQEYAQKAVDFDPMVALYHNSLARALILAGDEGKGVEQLEAALRGLIGKYDTYSDTYVYVTLRDPEGVLAAYEQRWNEDYRTSPDLFTFPESAWLRGGPRWKEQVRKDGILDTWRKHGFPQQCKPLGDDDFECD